ncbi:molybdopterin synthase sulfur carrier subunit [Diplodia corticola]|uniref:Molybdopterin synthase sulfur carrier subunit n=1 Tax=Diplodia corticola TaxID=236234 RepID=A0A1J9SIZ3_9PEZI|nr:molybdopterin synthase sulfur carrier subunit [Diplodia corticola]OJD40327.1 molybdopterin synthase sulfur carrier subunit [Diplodia corticola]
MASAKPPAGHFKLLYFAAASTYTKKDAEPFAAPLPASRLFDVLERAYPGMKAAVLDSCAVTVNLQYIDLDDGDAGLTINEGDEVALIPPVSSG